jgi:molybdopterin converting factor small subunit
MPEIAVSLPTLLADILDGRKRIHVSGRTLAEALDDLKKQHPKLATHIFDETGNFREHVLCFINDTNTRWLKSMDQPLVDEDSLTIVQAVSGG